MIDRVAVVVPAADEQDEIDACLTALQAAVQQLHDTTRVRASVLVVLDDCHDRTAEVVAAHRGVTALAIGARRVGTARRHGAAAAVAGVGELDRLWLASTDADSRVPPGWLTAMLADAEVGADVVLGTVRPGPGLRREVEQAWYAAHELRHGHPHVHGANLGIRARAYAAIGGWRDLAAHEDVDLVRRALAAGLTIERRDDQPVVTSARIRARSRSGFASYLRGLDDELPA